LLTEKNAIYNLSRYSRPFGDIRVERSWRDWLVYLDVTNFLDKDYEKYYGRPGNERIFRLGVH
jgi:outer membrane cobalamin receptor